jgi:catalase
MPEHSPDGHRDGARRTDAGNPNIEHALREHEGTRLTTDQGVSVSNDQNSLRVGERGPALLEDFLLREKITHFDHERIPERVVHARGAGAHGHFQVYEPLTDLTTAAFLQDPSRRTPVFVRFSTVAGSRGSTDTPRDVRGFATKFYTTEGNFDLVGNNMPVFFIQDAIKFPDFVHAVKPEPNNEIPQAASAHDTFWDFIWLSPESTHMIMWLMSDRALPRSFAMMDGFGVHTFRLVNAEGRSHFVKFHWKPVLGAHSLVWDEAQKLSGKDPDFNRRDLWESIERGNYPEYELAIQVIEEGQEDDFAFDIRDATKIWPEELVPLRRIGRMVLDRNPENFFAETEQAAFHIGNLVPGIDVTDDPLLQGRLFSYLDTQLIRLGGPNFAQIPINRPLAEVHHNQRDGFQQHRVDRGRVSYSPNSLGGGAPRQGGTQGRGYVSYPERVVGEKVRLRSDRFDDHFGQATLFWNSMSPPEQEHIVLALRFELGKVTTMHVRERVVDLLTNVDLGLATRVADVIGVAPPDSSDPAGALRRANERLREGWETFGSTATPGEPRAIGVDRSPALSLANSPRGNVKGRKAAILAADGIDGASIAAVRAALTNAGALAEVIAPRLGPIRSASGDDLPADHTFLTMASVMYDAVFVPAGSAGVEALRANGDAIHFVAEAYKHCKPIGAVAEGVALLEAAGIRGEAADPTEGVVTAGQPADAAATARRFVESLGEHRFFMRGQLAQISA